MECGQELKEEGGPFPSLGSRDQQESLDEPGSWTTQKVSATGALLLLPGCCCPLRSPQRLIEVPHVPTVSSLGIGHSAAPPAQPGAVAELPPSYACLVARSLGRCPSGVPTCRFPPDLAHLLPGLPAVVAGQVRAPLLPVGVPLSGRVLSELTVLPDRPPSSGEWAGAWKDHKRVASPDKCLAPVTPGQGTRLELKVRLAG